MNFRILTIFSLTCVYMIAIASKTHKNRGDIGDPSCRQSNCVDRRCQEITMAGNSDETIETAVVDPSMSGVKLESITLTAQHCQSGSCDAWHRSNDTHVVVDGGCRAKFRVCLRRHGCQQRKCQGSTPEKCQKYNIVSKDQMELVPVGTEFGYVTSMKLLRQRSSVPCEQGKTFGFYKWIAFARKGCSGRFQICYELKTEDSQSEEPSGSCLPSVVENPDWSCVDMKLLSRINRPADKTITDDDGREVTIQSMTLVHQHSDISCEQGESFSSSGSVARAWGGCRGTFKICYGSQDGDLHMTTTVPSESPDLKCVDVKLLSRINRPVDKIITDDDGKEVTIQSMTLVHQHSDISCEQGESFSSSGSVARAWGGCRGTFTICYGSQDGDLHVTTTVPSESPDLKCVDVKLLSRINRPADKTITDDDGKEVTIQSMTLVHQHSDISCEQGESFRSSGSVARAWGGCRGTFKICYGSQDGDLHVTTTVKPDSSEWKCVDVNLLSRIKRPVEKTMTDDDGKEVTIQSMTLVHQHSDISCQQGESFSSSGSVARAWGGCRGTFKICYGPVNEEPAVEVMPGEVEVMPGEVEVMPGEVGVMPGEVGVMPGEVEVMPGEVGVMPGEVEVMPGEVEVMPGEVEVMPGEVEVMPGEVEVMPGEVEVMPGEVEVMPGEVEVMPGEVEVMPGEVDVMPGEVEVMPESPDLKCVDVNLLSRINRPVERTITDDDGEEVAIHSMTLVNQQSDIFCGRGQSYSSTGSVARAWGGCRGTFRICYSS